MSINIPTWFYQQFKGNIQMLSQQKTTRLRAAVSTGSHSGNAAAPVDQVGTVEMQEVTERFAPMKRVDAPTDRRWVSPIDADLPQLVDTFDQLKAVTDPKSALVQNAVAACNRKWDDLTGAAFFRTANTGASATTGTTNFDSTNQVVGVNVGGTASNLNVAKLRAAKKILLQNEAIDENTPIYCAITATEHDSLLNEIQIISMDFNSKPVMVDGWVDQFLGFRFIHSERPWLTTTATDDQSGQSKQIPVWVQSGMYLGIWNEVEVDISQRKDIQGLPWQVYHKLSAGATRIEEKKVVKIWCR